MPYQIWTPDEQSQLEELIEMGCGYDDAAVALGRTAAAIRVRARRTRATLHTCDCLTYREVAELLGFACVKTVTRLVARGWLKGSAVEAGQRTIGRVQRLDVSLYLASWRYWMTWHPVLIADPVLRERTTELRRDMPRWLTPSEVAARYHVHPHLPSAWIREGRLPAQRWGNWWVWEGHLTTWQLPQERVGHRAWRRGVETEGVIA